MSNKVKDVEPIGYESAERLQRILDNYLGQHTSVEPLDDSHKLVLCIILISTDDSGERYKKCISEGYGFGIYEMTDQKYQDLCRISACNVDDDEPVPVVLFKRDGSSFTIVDESQIDPSPENPGIYLLSR